MYRLDRYSELVRTRPSLFKNDECAKSIRIVTDESIILEQQRMFYMEAEKQRKPSSWFDLGVLAEDEWVLVLRDLVIMPNGRYGRYIRSINKTSIANAAGNDVVIFPVLGNEVVLIKHFRHEKREWVWEVPRGFGEPNLSPEQNARKELMEETKLGINRIIPIGGILHDNTYDNVVYFYAETHGNVIIDEDESIGGYLIVSIPVLREMILNGEIKDPYTIQAYTFCILRMLID